MTILRTGSNRLGGFTLIEVLVTAVILFAGLGAVLKAYSLAVTALESSADVLATSAVLDGKATDLELQLFANAGQGLMGGGGRTTVDGVEYRWEAQCRQQVRSPVLTIHTALLSAGRASGGLLKALSCEWTVVSDPPRGGP